MNHTVLAGIILTVFLTSGISGQTETTPASPPVFFGYTSFEAGQIVKGFDVDGAKENGWLEAGYIGIGLKKSVTDRFQIIVLGEGSMGFSYRVKSGFVESYRETQAVKNLFTIKRGEGLLTLGDDKKLGVQLELGFFPYKYNDNARNLGEYLFRSTCYPQFIVTTFDRPFADLLGMRAGFSLWQKIRLDLLLTSETRDYPVGDFSLSGVARYEPLKGIVVGGGINFSRLLPVNEQLTTPTFGGRDNQFVTPYGDTGYFSYAGTKLMGRISLDPKPYLGNFGRFGSEDLKLYGEVILLGYSNYPVNNYDRAYYIDQAKRVPVCAGFNLPCFNYLDVLSIEAEYFDNDYPNSYAYAFEGTIPIPTMEDPQAKHDPLKWSVYTKKTIGKNFSIIGQCSRDHLIPITNSLTRAMQDRTDVTIRSGDWWWTVKTQFVF